jgi:lipopolysaccharide/colanic/teichoic acid biosynthesis glycosyltransferase
MNQEKADMQYDSVDLRIDVNFKSEVKKGKSGFLDLKFNKRVVMFYIIDILLVTISFLFFIWIKPASIRRYLPYYFEPFIIFLGIWLAASIPSHKYAYHDKKYLKDFLSPVLISDFIALSVVTVMITGFNHFAYSRMIVFGTIGLSIFFEIILFSLFYYHRKLDRDSEKTESIEVFLAHMEALANARQSDGLPATSNPDNYPAFSLGKYKKQIIEETNSNAYAYMCEFLDEKKNQTLVVSTTTRFNIAAVPADVFNVVINLKLVNDIKFVNKFFEAINLKLPIGGLFIGVVETNEIKKEGVFTQYPPVISHLIYFNYHYLFKRVFPKVIILKKIYFFLTNGFERSLSKAEALGRLYSCGYEVLNDRQVHGKMYFIARKITDPSFDMSPTYGPMISLKRVGKNGKIIHVYKLRTMHPFAEYLQDYVFKHNNLEEGGKFKNDFRVSTLGRYMRKFWIDELPMLYNFVKGDLKLVGARPLSKHYFNLYSEEVRERRIKYKPGLVPPFYVDMPKTLKEIMASEMHYFDEFDKHPFRTDVRYFFIAIYNILFKKARSK